MENRQELLAVLARHVSAVSCRHIEDRAEQKAIVCLVDFLGASFTQTGFPWVDQAVSMAESAALPDGATVIGTRVRAALPQAAFANGVKGSATAQMDTLPGSACHPGVAVMPAVLAAAEGYGASGAVAIEAIVAGYDVIAAIGNCMAAGNPDSAFRRTSVAGPLGAAAAAGKVLGLDEAGIASAIGLAAHLSGGLMEWAHAGTVDLIFQNGFAAQNGVIAALLAREGAGVAPTVLDGRSGLLAAMNAIDKRAIVDQTLDRGSAILGISHKPAPACFFAQTPIQAALRIVGRRDVTADDVDKVTVATYRDAIDYPGCAEKESIPDIQAARMSLPFGVAAAMVKKNASVATWKAFDDPNILSVMRKVDLVEDDRFSRTYPGRQGATIAVLLKNGSRESETLDDLLPMTSVELVARATDAVATTTSPEHADKIVADAMRLTESKDVRSLTSLFGRWER